MGKKLRHRDKKRNRSHSPSPINNGSERGPTQHHFLVVELGECAASCNRHVVERARDVWVDVEPLVSEEEEEASISKSDEAVSPSLKPEPALRFDVTVAEENEVYQRCQGDLMTTHTYYDAYMRKRHSVTVDNKHGFMIQPPLVQPMIVGTAHS
ncbi:hypothetical protein CEUSTIGMA_g13458.t1 [Chlamydomonas eustigma]|uniref:Uncharacterized protein n=1 Tax=Chlamydomonas eustigma TaxID=1157962 RepID=A0A250XSQ1_9CHLO|nr:hypothetical protein CEUSTIGMA_g13458.t1 [Chlamydomonas eustigma]|eukprot:GAX86043.1 hypothetical protein CEUSTIGMA_g13458.t1 [Chlamydomonas eustigma]